MLIEYLYRKSIGARGGGRSSQEPARVARCPCVCACVCVCVCVLIM